MLVSLHKDLEFYEAVSRTCGNSKLMPLHELRATPRKRYRRAIAVAPLMNRGDKLPPADEYLLVPCRDLSTGGLGFVFSYMPEWTYLAVRLEGAAGPLLVLAEVVHRQAARVAGRNACLVGCRFIERLT